MQSNKKIYNPFIRTKDNTQKVMFDVVWALLPCLVMSYFAFGYVPLLLVLTAVGSAVIAEFLFSLLFFRRADTVPDGSAIVTGILLAFTLGAFTPLHVAAFGGAMGVIFGKLLWGGLGRNVFNPALIGREFMTIFFPSAMASGTIWYNQAHVNLTQISLFDCTSVDELFFRASGAVGEYSIFFLTMGGLYLLLRRRISWHIPFALLGTFSLVLFIFMGQQNISFSLSGLLLGTLFMATDMPSSASTPWGKVYYGAMIGLAAMLFILNDVRYEYMSYSILLLNAFTASINWVFRPRTWGKKLNIPTRLWQTCALTGCIITVTFGVIYLHQQQAIQYVLYAYILFCIVRFIAANGRKNRVSL